MSMLLSTRTGDQGGRQSTTRQSRRTQLQTRSGKTLFAGLDEETTRHQTVRGSGLPHSRQHATVTHLTLNVETMLLQQPGMMVRSVKPCTMQTDTRLATPPKVPCGKWMNSQHQQPATRRKTTTRLVDPCIDRQGNKTQMTQHQGIQTAGLERPGTNRCLKDAANSPCRTQLKTLEMSRQMDINRAGLASTQCHHLLAGPWPQA